MAKRLLAPVLTEILSAIEGIQSAVAGKTIEDFKENWLLRRGVERGIEIISEAARHVPDEVLAQHPDIPWKQVRGVGNVLRHEYHRIAETVIWDVVANHLDPLKSAIEAMLKSHSTE